MEPIAPLGKMLATAEALSWIPSRQKDGSVGKLM